MPPLVCGSAGSRAHLSGQVRRVVSGQHGSRCSDHLRDSRGIESICMEVAETHSASLCNQQGSNTGTTSTEVIETKINFTFFVLKEPGVLPA
jgi:hypothetical protein